MPPPILAPSVLASSAPVPSVLAPSVAPSSILRPLVVHVFPSFALGGAQARFTALANRFGPDFRHRIVALDGDLAARARLDPGLAVDFPAVTAPKNALLGNALRFRRLLRAWQPDLLVTCNWGAIEFALANLLPVTRHLHVEDGFGPEERNTQLPRRVWLRRLALRGSTVVLPSRTLERIAREVWHLPAAHLRFVPNGIPTARFAAPPRPDRAEPVIGTVAALRPEKAIDRLIRAFARLVVRRPARLAIVGDGPERVRLAAVAASCGVADRVQFVGHQADTAPHYVGFDVFALSSDTEQMPLSLLEAMAAGLPVAATDVGDVRGMLAAANAPFVTPPQDAALAEALDRLCADHALRCALGEANRARAVTEFDEARMAASWRALWDGPTPAP